MTRGGSAVFRYSVRSLSGRGEMKEHELQSNDGEVLQQ